MHILCMHVTFCTCMNVHKGKPTTSEYVLPFINLWLSASPGVMTWAVILQLQLLPGFGLHAVWWSASWCMQSAGSRSQWSRWHVGENYAIVLRLNFVIVQEYYAGLPYDGCQLIKEIDLLWFILYLESSKVGGTVHVGLIHLIFEFE